MALVSDAVLRVNERKAAAGLPAGGMATFEGNPALRYAVLADLDLNQAELERIVGAVAVQSVVAALGGVDLANTFGGTWLDGLITGITVERIRLERADHRRPYVGEGAEGARRSAEVDREEAATFDRDDPRYAVVLDSASRWDRQAVELDAVACTSCGHRRDKHDPGCIARHPMTGGPCPCVAFTTAEGA